MQKCRNEEIITIIITNKKVSSLQKHSLFNDSMNINFSFVYIMYITFVLDSDV